MEDRFSIFYDINENNYSCYNGIENNLIQQRTFVMFVDTYYLTIFSFPH